MNWATSDDSCDTDHGCATLIRYAIRVMSDWLPLCFVHQRYSARNITAYLENAFIQILQFFRE